MRSAAGPGAHADQRTEVRSKVPWCHGVCLCVRLDQQSILIVVGQDGRWSGGGLVRDTNLGHAAIMTTTVRQTGAATSAQAGGARRAGLMLALATSGFAVNFWAW